MDSNSIDSITALADKYIARENIARERLAARLTDMTKVIDGSDLRTVTEAIAAALPFRMLMDDANENGDFAEAFRVTRRRLTRTVLSTGPSHSSCAMTNEAERIRFASFRDFLSMTEMYED